MFVERLFPQDSSYYKTMQNHFLKLGEKLDRAGVIHLFTIWTLTVSGIVMTMGQNDRFVYWEWSGWQIGFVKLFMVSIIFILFFKPNKIWIAGTRYLKRTELGIHTFISIFLLLVGWVGSGSSLFSLVYLIPYITAFLSILLIFQFSLELDKIKREWFNNSWVGKELIFSISSILMFISIALGVYFDDPIISTAGMVSIPFPLIALIWPGHVRHLQRARFYPIFIFAMFLCVRAPWFLIPLILLFFVIRVVNYFRYGIVYPSFGVDLLEEI
tara:strand:- start:3197 stop:4009 length:813 start_codon:yes stop_codon:yes gene_type:complete